MAASAPAVPPVSDGRSRLLVAGAILALMALLAFAGTRAFFAVRAYQRLHALRTGETPRDPAALQPWLPLRMVARHYRIPESYLEDGLRDAGFTLQEQPALPDVPDAVGGLLGRAPDRRRTPGAASSLLPPERQSLRQIAGFSRRQPEDAEAAARAIVRRYYEEHGIPLPARSDAPRPPLRPRPSGAPGTGAARP